MIYILLKATRFMSLEFHLEENNRSEKIKLFTYLNRKSFPN